VDPFRFDGIARHLAQSLPRRSVVAGSLGASLLGVAGIGPDALAKKKKSKKKSICHCPTNDPATCTTIKVRKKARKQHLKHLCDYDGECQPGVVGQCEQPIVGCTQDSECAADFVCRNLECVPGCQQQSECDDGFICKNGGCVCEADNVLCGGQCVDLTTDTDNCGRCGRECGAGEVCSNGFTCQPAACLAVTEIENDVRLDDDGGLRLVAADSAPDPDPPYVFGAVGFAVPDNTTFADITSITSGFHFLSGTCGAGTPRVCVQFSTRPDCVCGQFPAASGCDDPRSEGSTGNLVGNETPFDWFSLCGSSAVTNTYSAALAEFGDDTVSDIFLVADSSHGTQVVVVEPCIQTS
jgi:hypothetical protein